MSAAFVLSRQQTKIVAISVKFKLMDIQFLACVACGRRRISDVVCFRRLDVSLSTITLN